MSTIHAAQGVGQEQPLRVDNLLLALEERMGTYAVGKLLNRLETGSPDEQNIASGLRQLIDGRQTKANDEMPTMTSFVQNNFVANGASRIHDDEHRGTISDTAGRKTQLRVDLEAGTLTAVNGQTGGEVTTKFSDLAPEARSRLGHTAMNQILPGDTLETSPWLGFENALHQADYGKPKWVSAEAAGLADVDHDFIDGFETKWANGSKMHGVGLVTLTGEDGTRINALGNTVSIDRTTEHGTVRTLVDSSDKAMLKAIAEKVSAAGAGRSDKAPYNAVAHQLAGWPVR